MEAAETVLRTSGPDLWQHLAPLSLFSHFSDEQRSTFLQGYEREAGMRVVEFQPADKVCDKGKYELDLCFILKGTVDLLDQVAGKGYAKVASLPTGAFYGELGALGGLPRSTDVVAGAEGAQIFYLPRYCLKYLFVNPQARDQLNDLYRERALRVVAAQNDLFNGVPKEFVDALIPHTKIDRYDLRGIVLVKQGDVGDALYIVRDGYLQVATDSSETGHKVHAYLRTDDYFGEIALLSDEERHRVVAEVIKESGAHDAGDDDVLSGKRNASVLTAGKSEVIRIPAADFRALLDRFPDVHARVYETAKRRMLQTRTITPEISAQLERSGQLGYIQADALLVMDLDLCVKCDQCVKACETLHGVSRLNRTGGAVGKYLVPAACRHCDDPKCMNSCPTGAIKRRPEGEIYFQYDMCVGCGNCAIACPYDNIAMIETAKFDAAQAKKSQVAGGNYYRPYPVAQHAAADAAGQSLWHRWFSRHDEGEQERVSSSLFSRILAHNAGAPKPAAKPASAPPAAEHAAKPHIPPAFPIKCDLCDGLPFMGCVHSCPTGAAMRISGRQLFEQFGAVTFGSVRVNKSAGGKD